MLDRTSAVRSDGALTLRCRRWLRDALQDVPVAARQLRRSPRVAGVVVATLAVGIGANATMAGAIDRLLLRPPPGIREPHRLTRLVVEENDLSGRVLITAASRPALSDLRQDVPALEEVAGYWSRPLPFGEGLEVEDVRVTLVTPAFFRLLGAAPALGRFFSAADAFPQGETPGGPALAVISNDAWRRRFGGDSAVLGRRLRLGSTDYTVAGVAERGFRGLEADAPFAWLPVPVAAEAEGSVGLLADRGIPWLTPVGRLRPGASRAGVEAQATIAWRQRNPSPAGAVSQPRVVAASIILGRGPDAPREVRVALWLGGLSVLVLLIACANVTNILLARALARRREIAMRLALGAGRGRVARMLLADALLLAALGAASALALAAAAGSVLRPILALAGVADGPAGFLDVRLLFFTAAASIATAVLVSLAPLLQIRTVELADVLRTGGGAGGGRTSRARAFLLGTQAALCASLLIVAGLFGQSLRRVEALDLGYDVERTWEIGVQRGRADLTLARRSAALEAACARVRLLPGVERVALAATAAAGGGRAVAAQTTERGLGSYRATTPSVPMELPVDSGFFRTIGARSLRGRDFSHGDVAGAPRVAVVNEPMARRLWPGEDALGRCVFLPLRPGERGPCVTIVGVVRGFLYADVLNRDRPLVYVPLAQQPPGLGHASLMVLRVAGDPAAVMPRVREAVLSELPPGQRLRVARVRDAVEAQTRPWRVSATMFLLFGGVALVIAAVGLYGVVAYVVTQRSTEIAVRTALGAPWHHVVAVVAGDGTRAVAFGLAAGVAAAVAARRWLGALLFQTSPTDARVIGAATLLLLAVAALAAALPAARALRRSPAAVLRVE